MCLCLIVVFFFSPPEIPRIIQLDLDLKYKTNIRELFEEFDNFLPGAIIGIAREMQPVYRYVATVGRQPPGSLPTPYPVSCPSWQIAIYRCAVFLHLILRDTFFNLLLTINSMGRWVCSRAIDALSFFWGVCDIFLMENAAVLVVGSG